jgi:NAD-dependent SIR2 family protein deacetylase
MERAGALAGVITQNVDRLHEAAGSRQVVELHGALADVFCLACGAHEPRGDVQERLLAQNPRWLERAALPAPDGDSELDVADVAEFEVVSCRLCGGVLKPGVVFFGGNVASEVLARAWGLFEETEALLVVGSSLTLFSGYRFVRRANETGRPVAILNLGPTRADGPALGARLSARAGEVLPRLAEACGITVTF